jgi:repressor LexA
MLIRPVIGEPALDCEEGIDRAGFPSPQPPEQPALVDDQRANPRFGEADETAILPRQGDELGAVIHTQDNYGLLSASSTRNLPHDPRHTLRHIRRSMNTPAPGLDPHNPNAALLAAIDARLGELKLSERKACLKAGLHPDAIRSIRRGSQPKIDKIDALALALGVPLAVFRDLASRNAGAPPPATSVHDKVPLVGFVQAGYWTAAYELPPEDHEFYSPPPLNAPRGAKIFALQVRGESMNKIYPDSSILFIASYPDLGLLPNTGDKLVCLRRSPTTDDFEATAKQYELGPDGQHVLWPRSNDPDHQQPIVLPNGLPLAEWGDIPAGSADTLILGKVIGSFRPE